MNRARTVAGVSLMGTFMCGLFTCQALPLLAPFQAAQEYGIALLFLGALATGFLFGMLSPSIAYGVFAGFASIVLGLVLRIGKVGMAIRTSTTLIINSSTTPPR
jgi:predicted lipid-binding transport protein (Tim44 family)